MSQDPTPRTSAAGTKRFIPGLALIVAIVLAAFSAAAEPGDPIRLTTLEGDIAGMNSILTVDGHSVIGLVEYRQHRRGEVLEITRVSRFRDGSSDEDRVQAKVGATLTAIRGRSIIRDTRGQATVDITIDVAAGRITGFSGLGKKRENYDEKVALPSGTYWGPLLPIVLKNFDRNAVDGRLVVHTVIATPKPRVFDMVFIRKQATIASRPGGSTRVVRFALSPTFNMFLDPIIRMFIPETNFYIQAGEPPALVRFEGPRNFAGQKIRIE